jgi:hypothetical protein
MAMLFFRLAGIFESLKMGGKGLFYWVSGQGGVDFLPGGGEADLNISCFGRNQGPSLIWT